MLINSNNCPLVSVIMNCYNGETYLFDSIKSILDQTYNNFEIIFWDNQSKDNSAIIFKSFKDKRLKYYYAKKHTSLYKARNLAIQKSKGKFIAFLDTDDIWVKDKLNLQIKKFINKKIGVVYANYYTLNQATGFKAIAYKKELPEGVIYRNLLKNYFLGIGTAIVRKEIFIKKKNFDENFNIIGDFDFFTRISKNTYFAKIQDPLLIYRIHKNSFSNKNYQMYINEFKLWLKKQKLFNENSIFFVKQKIVYMEAVLDILNKKYISALKNILKIVSNKKKIKLIFFIFIPNFIFIKLKSNFS
jgi:glycosyltransferase involved in cell wall biosynthesis